MKRRVNAWLMWSMANPRPYRALVVSVFLTLIAYNIFAGDGWWRVGQVLLNLACLSLLMWLWWRNDVRDELSQRVSATMGDHHYGDLMWLVAQHMRTRSIIKINDVLRRHDVMRTPVDDLPPEARLVRETLESLEL